MKGRTTVRTASMQGLAMAAVDGKYSRPRRAGGATLWGAGHGRMVPVAR